jgi:hypothetical protein
MRPLFEGMHLSEGPEEMARSMTRLEQGAGTLSEEQWHELMRSLIDDVDAPGDEESENSLLQEVASRDHAGQPPRAPNDRSS